MHDILPQNGMCSESHDLFKFWQVSDNISEMVQDKRQLKWKANRKSYVADCGLVNGTTDNAFE